MPVEEFRYPPFPEFESFARDTDMMSKATGAVAVKLPRILGKGSTRAIGLDMQPAPIERKMELTTFAFPEGVRAPESVLLEIREVKKELDGELRTLTSEEGARRLCSRTLARVSAREKGIKNNHFFAGRLVLAPDKKKINYSWGITPHYGVISKIPPDEKYLVAAYEAAENKVKEIAMDPREFEIKLRLAWVMARHFSTANEVLIVDVARMFAIAAQDMRFWQAPQRRNFRDLPEAIFVLNFLIWKQQRPPDGEAKFELVPAVLSQTLRPDAQVFYLPLDPEGTNTRPYKYMRMKA